jgi:RNA-directed DNA polymerase
MQKKLSQWATNEPTKKFVDLYSLLCNEVWLRVAHHKVNSNEGRETAGVDGETMSNFNGNLDGNLEELRRLLKTRTFEPVPVRRQYILKADGKKKRPLGIPTIRDRIVQEALRTTLEPIWEADFSQRSYGFRPNRSTYDALSYLSNRLAANNGDIYQWVIEGDITSYFDTIPHRRLIKAVKKRVADGNIRDLLWQFLRAGVMYRGHLHETVIGTPQGGIVSPLLANIYLHELDRYMESNYLQFTNWQRVKRRRAGKGNYLYVRYADDFVVLCNGTKAEAQTMKEEIGGHLSTMGLTLSKEKTKITHITEGFQFLGYWIERSIGTKGEMVLKVLIPQSTMKKFLHKVREITAPHTTSDSVNAKILALNRFTKGWCQYYRCTSSTSQVFNKLNHELFWEMAHWLGKKFDLDMPKVMRRFRKKNTFGTSRSTMAMPDETKQRKRLVKVWHNPYTESEEVGREKERIKRESLFVYNKIWTGYEHRPEGMDLREEILLRDGPICANCKKTFHPSEVHVDHIVLRAKFKNPTDADRLENLQVLCNECHRVKTKTDQRVLSRMR